jgi:hypothetical protein
MKTNRRTELNFLSTAKTVFSFLTEGNKYKIIRESDTYLKLKSGIGYIIVYHGRLSYEIGVEFSPIDANEGELYTFEDLISLVDKQSASIYRRPSASTPDDVKNILIEQSNLLKEYGSRVLEGDERIWTELKQVKESRVKKYWSDRNATQVRAKANQAFRESRYKDYVNLLQDQDFELTKSEKKKLAYAEKNKESSP